MADRRGQRVVDLARAVLELGVARLELGKHRPTSDPASHSGSSLAPDQSALVDRVAFVIPRIAARLPWRADCLVQALAAQRWLSRAGIATRLTLGVPKTKKPAFAAHAWLSAGDRIVTGGDVSGYVPFEKS